MNILFLTDNFPPESNAPANRTFEHAKSWVQKGHTVNVITCVPNFPNGKVYEGYKNKWYQVEHLSGIRVVRVRTYMTANERFNRRVFDFFSFMVSGAVAAMFQKKPDVIIATSPQFFCGVAGMISAWFRRVPFVLEVRDLWPDSILALGVSPTRPAVKILRILESMMYRRAKLIIVVSKAFIEPIQKHIPDSDKIRVVTNGVDSQFFSSSLETAISSELQQQLKGKLIVGYIGTHGRAHGLLTVINAARSLKHNENIVFLFVGTGEKKLELVKWTKEKQLKNVIFIDQQPREDIPSIVNLCSITLVPLRNIELFSTVIPSKIFEYMALGKPMIVSIPKGETTALIQEYDCGLIVPPEDSNELSDAVNLLYKNSARLSKLGKNAKLASADFERTEKANQMIRYVQDYIG